jgi:WD40-like Beta Propeller Repeat
MLEATPRDNPAWLSQQRRVVETGEPPRGLHVNPRSAQRLASGRAFGRSFRFHHGLPGEPDARFSPDGRWLAYSSSESGRAELFVESLSVSGAKWRISSAGRSLPRWRRDVKELFYLAANGTLMAVPINVDHGTLLPGIPQPLLATTLNAMPRPLRSFNVTPDGRRFLIATSEPPTGSASAVIISNWLATLKQRN